MKIRAGKKRAINKLIKIVADDELTTNQIYDRMLQQSSQRTDLTFRQLTNILGSYFEEVGYDKETSCIIWRNKNAKENDETKNRESYGEKS
jgi:hypothetical protein|tara:strand:+ start:559 stop:831 length:273 start_codon:yes stop_codon:yes gene_type:complete